MNMFDDAKKKSKISNLPFEYDIVRSGHIHKIKTGHISNVWIDKQQYTLSLFESEEIIVFKDPIDFQIFIFDNFYKITKILSSKQTVSYEYHLKKGFLHNGAGYAVQKFNKTGKRIESEYFLNGREIESETYIRLMREKKLKRIIEDYDKLDEI